MSMIEAKISEIRLGAKSDSTIRGRTFCWLLWLCDELEKAVAKAEKAEAERDALQIKVPEFGAECGRLRRMLRELFYARVLVGQRVDDWVKIHAELEAEAKMAEENAME